jgi:hypothetical protein
VLNRDDLLTYQSVLVDRIITASAMSSHARLSKDADDRRQENHRGDQEQAGDNLFVQNAAAMIAVRVILLGSHYPALGLARIAPIDPVSPMQPLQIEQRLRRVSAGVV